ncbi:MAG: tetratricopeptide repeat protein [Treponema sp.]|nr:tetratricopeptide repeat protein [Treponema sp.]
MKKIILAVCAALLLASCATVKNIPEDLTAAQLIQKGQDSLVAGQYSNAEEYLKTAIQRYGDDPAIYVEVRYELANLYYKSHKKAEAAGMYREIIDLYDTAEYGTLPTAYKRLAEIGLEKLEK